MCPRSPTFLVVLAAEFFAAIRNKPETLAVRFSVLSLMKDDFCTAALSSSWFGYKEGQSVLVLNLYESP